MLVLQAGTRDELVGLQAPAQKLWVTARVYQGEQPIPFVAMWVILLKLSRHKHRGYSRLQGVTSVLAYH